MNDSTIKTRIKYIDLIKAFAIFLVVWGHSIQYLSQEICFDNAVYSYIYSFHMPLFMIISGYFFSSGLKLSFHVILRKKAEQLLLPIVSWSFLLAIFIYLFDYYIKGKTLGVYSILTTLAELIRNSLWFIKCLFSCYVISYISLKLFRSEWIACVVTILVFQFFPSPFMERFMLPFFWIGIFLKKYYSHINKHRFIIILTTFTLFLGMLYYWDGSYTIGRSPMNKILDFKSWSFSILNLDIAIFRFFIGTTGSLFFIVLFHYLYSENIYIYKICEFGKNTLGIYILQFYILEKGISCLTLPALNPFLFNFIVSPIISIIIILICSFCINIIAKNRYTNLFFLGNKMQ